MKKGVTTNDPLADDDEKGIATVYTPDGTQQMTVQHIPDEWRRVGSVPTPGVDGMGLNGMDPTYPSSILRAATREQFRTRRPAPNFRLVPSQVFGALPILWEPSSLPGCLPGWDFFLLTWGTIGAQKQKSHLAKSLLSGCFYW